jgi:hypothetical protein
MPQPFTSLMDQSKHSAPGDPLPSTRLGGGCLAALLSTKRSIA